MASIERTAYPRFRKVVSARELLEAFTPTPEETAWAREATRTEANLLALVALLKALQRLGYFPRLAEVPSPVMAHVRQRLGLGDEVAADADSARTLERYRGMIRERVGVTYDPEAARTLAEEAIRAAAQAKDNPADLINVALEELVKARYELPGYTTLDEMAARLRAAVNSGFFEAIEGRVGPAGKAVLLGLLHVDASTRRSRFDELKRPARRPSLSRLKEHVERLRALDAVGDTATWLSGVPPAQAAHFAGEAGARRLRPAQSRRVQTRGAAGLPPAPGPHPDPRRAGGDALPPDGGAPPEGAGGACGHPGAPPGRDGAAVGGVRAGPRRRT